MRVLLIQPPFSIFKAEPRVCHPSLGLAYLAAILKKEHDVLVIDALASGYENIVSIDSEFIRYGLSFEDIKEKIAGFTPDVVGISCLFSAQAEGALKVAKAVKELNPATKTVIGGAHPSSTPESVLADSNVDYVIIGEGEKTFRALLQEGVELGSLDGIAYKKDQGVVVQGKKAYLENLDELPFPDWSDFDLDKYFKVNLPHGGSLKHNSFLPVITSRGCPFDCIFCSVHNIWGKNYRKRSAKNVLDELQYLVENFKIKEILFEDDNITFDKERAREIFQGMIDRKLGLSWSTPNGVALQTLDDEMLELMKASGCYSISLGVESGDEQVLNQVIKKPIKLEMVRPLILKARRLGLKTNVFFVVGLPGESREQLKRTFKLAESLDADTVNFFYATPLPGTRLQRVCLEKKMIDENIDLLRMKSDFPSFGNEEFSVKELREEVSCERVKLYLLYLLRHPVRFIMRLFGKLKSDPKYFGRFFLRYGRV